MIDPISDPAILAGYLTDASNLPGHAEGLLRPSSTAEVAAIVRHCQAHGIPLTITAARTATTGSAVPQGGWVMSMERMSAIEHVGHDTATAQAGVNLAEFQREIEASGRFFPPDPTSRTDCSLGGSVACNASGARSFRYGPVRPWVEAVEVVLPTGEIVQARRGTPIPAHWPAIRWEEPRVKTAAGYAPPADLLDLFIGQEGTLGVITRVTVKLTDLPHDVVGFFVFFPDRSTALSFVDTARTAARQDRAGLLSPRCLEYFDRHCLDLARDRDVDVPAEAQVGLYCEQELTSDEALDDHLAVWWEALEASGSLADDTILATDAPGRAKMHAIRHAIPAGLNEVVVRNGMPKVGTDLAVPDGALATMMDAYEAAPIRRVLFGHVGDNHLHLNMLPETATELAEAKAYYDQLARLAISLDGTVSAEHGIGKLKVRQLSWMIPDETLKAFRSLKRCVDERWILGRGNLFDPEPPEPHS